MSRLDPGLLAPQLPRINPGPTPEERARQDAAIADQQMQIQERQAQADSLRLANQEKRDSYNASMGMRAYMANHADQMKGDPQSFISGLRSVGGKYADPLITSYIQQDKDRLANQEKALGFQESMTKDQIAALSALPDDATDQQKYDALTPVYQKYVQSGILTDQQANKMHTMPVDSQGDLQAHQNRLAQARKIHDDEIDNNKKIADALEATGKGEESQAEAALKRAQLPFVGQTPGVNVPFPDEVQKQKIEEKSVPQPPMSDARFQQELALEKAKAATANAIPPLDFIKETSSQGLPYIDASKVEPKTLNVLQTAAGQAGIPVVDKDTAGGLRDAATVKLQQQRMMDLLDGRLADTPLSRILVAPENKAKQLGQLDPNLAVTGTFVGPAIQALRAMAGGKNFRITQAEINNAIDNFVPKATDTVAVARKKVETITGFINDKERVALGNKGASSPRAGTVIDPAGKEHQVSDVDAAIRLHPGTKEKK